MKFVFILSDALRYDYVDLHNMNFLNTKRNESLHFNKIIPGVGFCEISEYVSGRSVYENGNFTQINFSGNFKELETIKGFDMFKYLDWLNKIPRIRRYYNNYIERKLLASELPEDIRRVRYQIPFEFISSLEATESRHEYDSANFFSDTNIFHWLKKQGLSYDIEDFVKHNKVKGTDHDRMNRLVMKIKRNELKDFTLLYIGYGELAHFLGTKNNKFATVMQRYDYALSELYTILSQQYEDHVLAIVGDHGMIDVRNHINVKPILTSVFSELSLGRDYFYFIDSTQIRVWLKEKNKIEKIEQNLLSHLEEYIDSNFDLSLFKPTYGDIIIPLKPGSVFYPDFFNNKKVKGMHGYNNNYNEQHGTAFFIGNRLKSEQHAELHLHELQEQIKAIVGLYK
jgi:predicted AlkP superfamily pyrophosphatase or phosphodiesterase